MSEYIITMQRDAKQTLTVKVEADSLEEAIASIDGEGEAVYDLDIENEEIEGTGDWDISGVKA